MKYKCFENSESLINYSYKFIEERLSSLRKDVTVCLNQDCAFPSLLYCFSTIDFLRALYTGFAAEGSNTRGNFKQYMCTFMKNGSQRPRHEKYSSEHADLIQGIFRDKIVHLAQPKLVVSNKNRLITWRYEYPEALNHLKIENVGKKKQISDILTPYAIFYNHIFVISITQFMSDIIDSVSRDRDGYLARVRSDYKNVIRTNFDNAISELYRSDIKFIPINAPLEIDAAG